MQLKSGTLLQGGKYKIIHHLGQGSFGITYLAEHTALGKRVCIKEFFMKELNLRSEDGSIMGLSEGTLSYNYAQKFRKEAMNLAGMEHPNIVRVTDSFDENGTFYYVMDYIEGQNLNEYIKDHALSESEAISIIKDVANALMYMHEQKHMLHLDLKPGNIMRRASDGHIFLIDFGLSKHYDKNGTPETSTTIGGGTPGYAPTEQGDKAKDGEFRPTIDVYALGATLFKLLTRETPPTASEVVNDDEILVEKLSNKGVSQSIIDLVVKAMKPGYKKRIQTMREFISALPGSTESFNSKQNHHTSPVDSEETIVTNSSNTPPNAKGFRENVYGNGQKKETENTVVEENYLDDDGDSNNRTIKIWGAIIGFLVVAVVFFTWFSNHQSEMRSNQLAEFESLEADTIESEQNIEHVTGLTFKDASGNDFSYTGEVIDGKPNGKGTGIYSYGTYTGDYVDGLRQGEGKFESKDGSNKYEGTFVDDMYDEGRLAMTDNGDFFDGKFKDGNPYNGSWYDKTGKLYSKVVNGK